MSSAAPSTEEINLVSPTGVHDSNSSSNEDITQKMNRPVSITPNLDEIQELRAKLAAVIDEKNNISDELSSFLRKEMETSFAAVDTPFGTREEETACFVHLNHTLDRNKVLTQENADLRKEAGMRHLELGLLKKEVSRMKEMWKSLNSLRPNEAGTAEKKDDAPSKSPSIAAAFEKEKSVAHKLRAENEAKKQEILKLAAEKERLINELRSMANRRDADAADYQRQIDALNLERSMVISQSAQVRVDHERLVNERHAISQHHGQQMQRMQEANRLAKEEAERLKAEMVRHCQDLSANNQMIVKLQADCNQFSGENQRLRGDLTTIQSKNVGLEDEMKIVAAQNYVITAAKDKMVEKLHYQQPKLAGLKLNLGKLKSDLGSMKEELQKHVAIVRDMKNEPPPVWIKTLSGNIGRLPTTKNESEVPSQPNYYEERLAALIQERDDWEQKYQSLLSKITSFRTRKDAQTQQGPQRAAGSVSSNPKPMTLKTAVMPERIMLKLAEKEKRAVEAATASLNRAKIAVRKLGPTPEAKEVIKSLNNVWITVGGVVNAVDWMNTKIDTKLDAFMKRRMQDARNQILEKKPKSQ